MFDWLKELFYSEKELNKNLSEEYYRSHIKLGYLMWGITIAVFSPFIIVGIIKHDWIRILVSLPIILWMSFVYYKGIKSLKEDNEIAILKEKIKQDKEKRDKEREKKDENEEEK